MLFIDQLRKNDLELRILTVTVLGGLAILLAGLWWVQVVSAKEYQAHLETQSYRTIRIPAVRGRISDQEGISLAENRPTYHLSLYLEELRRPFDRAYAKLAAQVRAELRGQAQALEKQLGRKLNREERARFVLGSKDRTQLRRRARYEVASNVVQQVSLRLGEPIVLDEEQFQRHYDTRLALPFAVVKGLSPTQIARFEERSPALPSVDIDVQSTRVYPRNTLAAHVLGLLQRDDSSVMGEDAFFSYRLPDYRGMVGIEAGYDKELRGTAGAKSVLVNNVGYRETEQVWTPAEPGRNVVLTLVTPIQEAAENALQSVHGPNTKGAVVVMDAHTGDLLAMVSAPTLNPNLFIQGITRAELDRLNELRAQMNRATQENYAPGSIFKTIVGLAALEAGLDPREIHTALPNPDQPGKAIIYVGRHAVRDLAPPGDYDFRRALKLSSNSYFISAGLRTGADRIVRLGQRFHFGERTGLPTRQEVSGFFPSPKRVSVGWTDGNTANLSIGQDPVLVTPLQVAVMTCAIANGGKVLWPRLVDRLEDQLPGPADHPVIFPRGHVRDELGVKADNLAILHAAMLADVEDPDGTGRRAAVPGMRIYGKTGTAQVMNALNQKIGQTTWFASFGSVNQTDKPRYAVVVMVENGASGGETCAPVAGKIYAAIQQWQKARTGQAGTLARTNP